MSTKGTRHRRGGAGHSIPGAAVELDVPYKTLRTAIAEGQAKTIRFGKQERMSDAEIERLRKMLSGEVGAA